VQPLRVAAGRADLQEELSPLLHDLLDLQEAGGVHQQELVAHVHAEPPCVAEAEDLLEGLGLDGGWQLHHRALAAVEKVPEVGAAGGQHGPVRLERVALHHHRDVAVQPLQPLLVQALQDAVPEVGDLHLQRLSHGGSRWGPAGTGRGARGRHGGPGSGVDTRGEGQTWGTCRDTGTADTDT